MGSICQLVSHTNLSILTIHKILFEGIEIKDDHLRSDVIRIGGFRCSVSLLPDPDMSENLILDLPENLVVSFYIGYSYEGLVSALKVVMNWLRNTTGDCAFVRDVETVLLMRVDGQTASSNSEDAWGYNGVTELIDVPHERADLRFARWEDQLYIRSTHGLSQIATNFCQHIVGDYEFRIAESSDEKYAIVNMDDLTKDIAQNSVLGLVLDNRDRRFSPENENAANPLAGKIQPLRPVRLTSNDGTTTRTHWSGWVESVHPAANKYGERLVKILCTGGLQFLSSTQTKIELQENQPSDQIIDALIQEVIFPPATAPRGWRHKVLCPINCP